MSKLLNSGIGTFQQRTQAFLDEVKQSKWCVLIEPTEDEILQFPFLHSMAGQTKDNKHPILLWCLYLWNVMKMCVKLIGHHEVNLQEIPNCTRCPIESRRRETLCRLMDWLRSTKKECEDELKHLDTENNRHGIHLSEIGIGRKFFNC